MQVRELIKAEIGEALAVSAAPIQEKVEYYFFFLPRDLILPSAVISHRLNNESETKSDKSQLIDTRCLRQSQHQ